MASNDPQSQTPVGLPPDVEQSLAEYPEIIIPPPVFAPTMFANGDRSALREDVPSRRWDDPPIVRRHPFEIYVTGQASAGAWPTAKCAWGTVSNGNDADSGFTIANIDDSFTLSAGLLIWLKCVFDDYGAITACSLEHGGLPGAWTDSPAAYPQKFAPDGRTWFHPIAHIRPALGTPIQSGEIVVGPGNHVIAQLTHTHLVSQEMCGADGVNIWTLVPGPGAVL